MRTLAPIALWLTLAACASTSNTPTPDAGSDAASTPTSCELCKVEVVKGQPGVKGWVDADQSAAARFANPRAVVSDGTYLYVADTGNAAVRRIELASGKVTTIAGHPDRRGAYWKPGLDGPAATATFFEPHSLALAGGYLFVGDGVAVRRIDLSSADRRVDTVKLANGDWFGGMRTYLAASSGKLYLGGLGGIFVMDPAQLVAPAAPIVGNLLAPSAVVDGTGTSARFFNIQGLAADSKTLYVADFCIVRRVDLQSLDVTTIAGGAVPGSCYEQVDGSGSEARFLDLTGITVDGDTLLVAEAIGGPLHGLAAGFGSLRRIDPRTRVVQTVAGSLPPNDLRTTDADGAALKARLFRLGAPWATPGKVYLPTAAGIRLFDAGQITTAAGLLVPDAFTEPGPLLVDGAKLLVVLNGRGELGRVTPTSGAYDVVAEGNPSTFSIDGASAIVRYGDTVFVGARFGIYRRNMAKNESARLLDEVGRPGGLVSDGTEVSYLLGGREHRLLQFDPSTTVKPTRTVLPVDHAYDLVRTKTSAFVAGETAIYRLDLKTQKLTPFAGLTGEAGCRDGAASTARFRRAAGLATDGTNVFVGDLGCHAVRAVAPDGSTRTLVGSELERRTRAGVGKTAALGEPRYLSYDAAARVLYVSDPTADALLRLSNIE